jgi:hypothetical protein
MLDSVTLLIKPQDFKIIDPNRFRPSTSLVYSNQAIKAVVNPTKQDNLANLYLPKVTLSRRRNLQGQSEIMLIIQASLPKLIFGNNLEELQTKDFDTVIAVLQSKLMHMGVGISTEHLKKSDIIAVHFSKNIVFKDGASPYHYIAQIQNSVLTSRLDTNKTDYRNAGHAFKWHCNSYEIIVYDKLHDLLTNAKSGPKRSIDRDNYLNLKAITQLRSKKKKFEVLRIEVRLNRRIALKNLFKKLGMQNNLTVQSVFKPSVMRKVLGHYIDTIKTKRSAICDFTIIDKRELLFILMIHNPSAPLKKVLSYIGQSALLQEMTANEINKMLKPKYEKSFLRLQKEFDRLILPSTINHSFDVILKQIQKYKAVRINS